MYITPLCKGNTHIYNPLCKGLYIFYCNIIPWIRSKLRFELFLKKLMKVFKGMICKTN